MTLGIAGDTAEVGERGRFWRRAGVRCGVRLRGIAEAAHDAALIVDDLNGMIRAQRGDGELAVGKRDDGCGRKDGEPVDERAVRTELFDGVGASVGDDQVAGGSEVKIDAVANGGTARARIGNLTDLIAADVKD